jgi:4-hydroxy-tetrahydrodipicolinate synthase
LLLPHVPSRTSLNIEPSTLLRLSQISNIVGIKEASSNIVQITEMISSLPDTFSVYSGNDDQILPILSVGGVGVISVLANILPRETHDLCESFFEGNIKGAQNIQLKYFDLIKKLFIEVNPAPVKEAMNLLEYEVGTCRLPLTNLSEKNLQLLKNSLESVNLI